LHAALTFAPAEFTCWLHLAFFRQQMVFLFVVSAYILNKKPLIKRGAFLAIIRMHNIAYLAANIANNSKATILIILIIGLMAGPAVSL